MNKGCSIPHELHHSSNYYYKLLSTKLYKLLLGYNIVFEIFGDEKHFSLKP